jgi:hypothetical protein
MIENDNPQSGDLQPKPMKGKYDGRKNNGKKRRGVKPGPKPLYLQRKTRNYSSRVLEKYDAIATVVCPQWTAIPGGFIKFQPHKRAK